MPFEYIIYHRDRLVVVRGTGECSLGDIADSARSLLEDTSIGRDYAFMFVVHDISLRPTPDEMWSIVTILELMLSRFSGRMAIVTSEVGSVTEANLVAVAADKMGGRLRVFTAEEQARVWLLETTLT